MSWVQWNESTLLKPCPLSQAICSLIEQSLLLRSTHSWKLRIMQGLLLFNCTLLEWLWAVHYLKTRVGLFWFHFLFSGPLETALVLASNEDRALLNVANRLWSLTHTDAGAHRLSQPLLHTQRDNMPFWLAYTSTQCSSVSYPHSPSSLFKPTLIA